MSGAIGITVDTSALAALSQAMAEFAGVLGKDSSQTLRKAGRILDLRMYEEMRERPPRPTPGSIIGDIKAGGWRMNTASDSYKTGLAAARKMLGGAKSGFFRVNETLSKIVADPVLVGTSGRILKAGRGRRGSLVKDRAIAPAGAVRLNVRALAMVRALNLREKAGKGGYMSIQFLTFRRITQGTAAINATFTARNKQQTGHVEGDNQRIVISARVENTATIAARENAVNKSFLSAADLFRSDLIEQVTNRAKRTIGRVANS
jgi:hypothetical protein